MFACFISFIFYCNTNYMYCTLHSCSWLVSLTVLIVFKPKFLSTTKTFISLLSSLLQELSWRTNSSTGNNKEPTTDMKIGSGLEKMWKCLKTALHLKITGCDDRLQKDFRFYRHVSTILDVWQSWWWWRIKWKVTESGQCYEKCWLQWSYSFYFEGEPCPFPFCVHLFWIFSTAQQVCRKKMKNYNQLRKSASKQSNHKKVKLWSHHVSKSRII